MKILIADDNNDAAQSLAMLLMDDGHEVQLAYDGIEAVTVASLFEPDAMILDIGMPRMTGHAVAHRIRASRGSKVFLIALSEYGQPEDMRTGLAAGFDAYLTKPADLDRLRTLLAEPRYGHDRRE